MLEFRLLGPLEVLVEGVPVDVGGRQPRTLLAVLLAAGGRSVAVDRLADAIWGESRPASATGTLQSYVSRIRRRLGGEPVLVSDDVGYRLRVDPSQVDFRRFETLVDEGRAALDTGRPDAARALLEEAERLWRGRALAEFADHDFAIGLATRLEERRLEALEARLDADLRLGRHAAAAGELTELVAAHPFREGLRAQLALALYRSGRQAEALRALADAGRTLRDELGIEPSRELRDLESAILAHDPSLDAPATGAPAPPGPPVPPPAPPAPPAPASIAAPATAEAGPRRPALVGRETEMAQLVAAFEESSADGRFVVIEGEPGIGKTRLADELRALASARGALAVWGRSDEGGAAPALWPWLAPLRALAERASDAPATLAELLAGEPATAAGQAQALQFERFEAMAELLAGVARSQPVVVLLDDLQWADATSLELLAFLAGRLGPGVLVVCTMRQLEVGRNDAVTNALAAVARRSGSRRLQLRGLAPTATAAVLEAAADRRIPGPVASVIHERAEGNPFYAIELSRLVDEEGGFRGEVPGSVGDVIRRRLTRMPTETVDLLGVAAVVGRDVELALLEGAAGTPPADVLDALEPAVIHRLLVEVPEQPATLRFSHALVREVLLEDMTSLRRARLHLKVADAIEARGAGVNDAEILAEHLWRAAPVGVGRRAAEALERAAEVALRRVSYAAAEDLLTKAVQLRRASGSTPVDMEGELMAIVRQLEVARARRYFQGAAGVEVLDRAKELAEACGRRDLLLNLLWFEWSALATSCRSEDAAPLAKAYYDLTVVDPRPDVRAGAHEVIAVWHWGAGRINEAIRHLDTAMEMTADLPPPTDPFGAEQRMVARTFWLFNHAVHGDLPPEDAFARFDTLLTQMPDRFAVASICGFAATTAIVLGRWEDAERYAAIGTEADPGSQFAFWGGQALMQRGTVLAWRGHVDEGIASFTEGKARYMGIGARSGLPTFQAGVAMHAARWGRLAEAESLVSGARAELEARKELWNEPVLLIAEAVVANAAGNRPLAADKLALAISRAAAQGSHALAGRALRVAAEVEVALLT
ncbi:MAG: BTAD domain-containing putative transcriptional regulator [Acidimicrobiia bacterium]